MTYLAKLVLERHLPVVVLLALDIVHHRIHMAIAHAERAITVLPTMWFDVLCIFLIMIVAYLYCLVIGASPYVRLLAPYRGGGWVDVHSRRGEPLPYVI